MRLGGDRVRLDDLIESLAAFLATVLALVVVVFLLVGVAGG